jgi:D-alanyl-D-alanine carboxypeptidase/D-alanyl-D-alanine-endopeptidase (penicillin-binding protein 4)
MFGGCTKARLPEPAALDPLRQKIDAILDAPGLAGTHWGIRVENDQGDVLFRQDDDIRVVPASTVKLLTTSSALVLMGPDYRIPTEFVAIGYIDTAGTLQGDLVITGYGDPSLAALNRQGAICLARQWADTLRQLGLRAINGSIWGDAMAIRSKDSRSSWEVDDLSHTYGANVSALSLAENSLQICVTPPTDCPNRQIWMDTANVRCWPSSTPIRLKNNVITLPIAHLGWVFAESAPGDTFESVILNGEISGVERPIYQTMPLRNPEPLFLAVVAEALDHEGIPVSGGIGGYVSPGNISVFRGSYYPGHYIGAQHQDTLFVYWSPPMSEIIKIINTQSHNLGAELLIRHLGWRKNTVGNFRVGKTAACNWMSGAGLDVNDISWVDGCGLARRNLMSPHWIVQLLQVMAHHPYADYFRSSLAVMGQSGTLESRAWGDPIEGNVLAKTGTMSGVSNICGYIQTLHGSRLVFAIMANGTTQSVSSLRKAQDRILNVLFDML